MLDTYINFIDGKATASEIEEANYQLKQIFKSLGLGFLVLLPFSPISIPYVMKKAKEYEIDLIPDWYKEMDLSTEWQNDRVVPTVKRCVPVRDYLTCGYAILNPYETQLRFENDETNTLKASNVCPAEDYVSAHPYNQCPINMHGKKNHYFKLS